MTSAPATRVLMTTDAVGGVWTYAVDLARGLVAQGFEVLLAVLGPPASASQRALVGDLAVIETGLPLDWLAATPGEVRASAAALARLSRELRVDLVHLNSPALAIGEDFGAPVLGAAHSCLATWWAAVKSGAMPEDFVWRTELQAEGLRACDGLIAPSRAFATAIGEIYGVTPRAVLNGRAAVATSATAPSECAVFTAGRLWDEGKNLAALDAAASDLDCPVFAAGPLSGPQGATIRFEHIEALGPLSQEEMRARLGRRPIFASTALYEPFGLAVLEAAQAACPLVLSDIPTFRELWSGAAVFVDPRDPAQTAQALRLLADNADERDRLGQAARARAETYTVHAMVHGTIGAYEALLRRPARLEAAA